MPLLFQKNINSTCALAVWHITEPKEELLLHFHENFIEQQKDTRTNAANALHYLASRAILLSLFPKQKIELIKDKFNKPKLFLNNIPQHISITHSHEYAAIIFSADQSLGIDLEKIDQRITRVKNKFMNENELEFAGENELITAQTLIWSAKETLYKLYGTKGLDFKQDLHIAPFQAKNLGSLTCKISKISNNQNFLVQYETIENYVLTYICQNQ